MRCIPMLVFVMLAGCQNERAGVRATLCDSVDGFCPPQAEACIAAYEAVDCDALEAHAAALATAEYETCWRSCPQVHPCPDWPSEVGYDCDCRADCIDAEPPESRQAQIDFIECITPAECR